MSNYPLIQVTKGTVDHLGGDNYKLKDVPKGESSTITVHNGSCTTIKNTAFYQCTCNEVEVTKPVSNGDGEYCEGNESIPELSVVLADSTYIAQWSDKYGNIVHTGTNFTPTPEQLYGSATKFYVKAIDINGCESDEIVIMMYENYPPQSVEIKDYSTSHCENTILNLDSIVTAGNSSGPFTFEWSVDAGSIVGSNTNSYVSILLPSEGTVLTVTLKVTSSKGCYIYQQYIIDDIEGLSLAIVTPVSDVNYCYKQYGRYGTIFNDDEANPVMNHAWGINDTCDNVNNPPLPYHNNDNRLNLVSKEGETNTFIFTGIYEINVGAGFPIPEAIGFSVDNFGKLEISVNGVDYQTVFDFPIIADHEYYLGRWWVKDISLINGLPTLVDGDVICFKVTGINDPSNPTTAKTFGVELYGEQVSVLETFTEKLQVDSVVVANTDIFNSGFECADGSDPVIENCVGYCNCTN